jgi:TetR/AcrR family transcriptional regulator, regulator of autoinduction and epiphytic fitness
MATMAKADGRAARAERTRLAIVEALVEILDGGNPRPTVEEIAGRAGVSERTVFQHFPDREALFEATARFQYERVVPTLAAIDPGLPLGQRIDAFTSQRARLLETVSGVRRGALLIEHESDTARLRLQEARQAKAREVKRVFAPELEALPKGERGPVRAALVALASWSCWESWRAHQGLQPDQARAAMRAGFERLLSGKQPARPDARRS